MADSSAHQQFGKTRAEWLANLNTEYKPARNFRRTSIICTIGTFESEKYQRSEVRGSETRDQKSTIT